MSPLDVLLIVAAFALILWGAESFTDGVEWLGRMLRFGPYSFKIPVGEMEAWATRTTTDR